MMIAQYDECRWCGNPRVYQLGLCHICHEEHVLAGMHTHHNGSPCDREVSGMVGELTNRRVRERILVVD
ncbi:MAG: hypothetical protein Kow0099_37570 [Candidatus Abyssubacteria bacterium]